MKNIKYSYSKDKLSAIKNGHKVSNELDDFFMWCVANKIVIKAALDSYSQKLIGLATVKDITDPSTGDVLIETHKRLTESDIEKIIDAGIDHIDVAVSMTSYDLGMSKKLTEQYMPEHKIVPVTEENTRKWIDKFDFVDSGTPNLLKKQIGEETALIHIKDDHYVYEELDKFGRVTHRSIVTKANEQQLMLPFKEV